MSTLVEDLSLPEAYEGPVATVERIVTHISWVFLTPGEVFKVKRPVGLGFLDFRTLEARRVACEAEVTLNRRLAPGVYLGVVPVCRDADGRHRVGGDGEVVDWAVHMVRLPDAQRADCVLEAGALDGAAIDRIALALAHFHADAACAESISRFGSADAIARNVTENFAQTRGFIDQYLSPEQSAAVERFQLDFLRDRASFLAARVSAGRVRDGHGDLRLEHVYLGAEGLVRVIDCIEFNDRFRYADVCADLAFLAMDLAWHGRTDLAERLLARYARETDDHDLYAVVDFYESYRAYVRGKVSGMLAADPGVSAEVSDRASHEARRYFLLALAAGRRPLMPPSVVAVGGVIASGKSTVADAVGLSLSAPVIDSDRTRKHMLGVAATQPVREAAWQGGYDPAMTGRVYEEVLRRARVVLASGRAVVIDASFRSASMRAAAKELSVSHRVPFCFVMCQCPAEVCMARLARRATEESVSDGRAEIFRDFCARFEPATELAEGEHVVLDTSRPLGANLAALCARLLR